MRGKVERDGLFGYEGVHGGEVDVGADGRLEAQMEAEAVA